MALTATSLRGGSCDPLSNQPVFTILPPSPALVIVPCNGIRDPFCPSATRVKSVQRSEDFRGRRLCNDH